MELLECARTSANSDQTSDEFPEQQITSRTLNRSIGELHLLHALFTPSYTILSIDTLFPLPSGDVNKSRGRSERGEAQKPAGNTGGGRVRESCPAGERPNETTRWA